jgi:murein hydrolase activator
MHCAMRNRLIAGVIVVALSIATAHSQTRQNADLDRIRGEIVKLRDRLEDVRRQARSAQQELEEVDLELGIRSRELEIAVDLQARLEQEQRAVEQQIADLTPKIERQKKYLSKRLVVLYRFGGLSYLRMFLAIDQRRDPIEAMSMLSYLVSRDARAVSRFQAAKQQLSLRYFDLADRQKRLAQMRQVVEDRRRAVAAAHVQKERLVASLRTEESASVHSLADLEEKARRLERLITSLSKQQSVAAASDIRAVQGALAWPVEGKIVERFGKQRNPKFDTVTSNNGLKIAAAPGAAVRAVFGGTVLFSQWFKGYGNLIVLDHGNRVFSLYGNLKGPGVTVGERVATGQPIAGVGEAEDARTGYLYFEIRNDNHPEDPQTWLR